MKDPFRNSKDKSILIKSRVEIDIKRNILFEMQKMPIKERDDGSKIVIQGVNAQLKLNRCIMIHYRSSTGNTHFIESR